MTYFKYLFKSFNYFTYCIYQNVVIFFHIVFVLLILQNNLNFCYFYNNIAFNIYFLYSSKHITLTYKIKKIYSFNTHEKIHKLNNLFFKKRFLKKNIKNYLNKLKFSGFIYSINYHKLFLNTSKYCLINIRYNYFVKTIKVKNFNNLIIPTCTLQKLFNHHIGLPKNYKLIYQSIKSILFWYHVQGFVWAKISLIHDQDINSINLIINEGKIVSSTFVCRNYQECRENKLINKNIQSMLSLSKGNILNKKQLEKQLQIIKQTYNIEEIKYIVKLCNEGLLITVKYSIKNIYFTKINYFPSLNCCKIKLLINSVLVQINQRSYWFCYKFFCSYLLQLHLIYYKNIHVKLNFCSYTFYFYRHIQTFIYSSLNYINSYYSYDINYINQLQKNIYNNYFVQNVNLLSILNIKLVNISRINRILQLKQKVENYLYQCKQYFLNIYYIKYLQLKFINKYSIQTTGLFSLYTINIHHKSLNLLLTGIYTIKLKINYYLLKNNHFYHTISNISIINKFKQQIYFTYLYYYLRYNISNLLINKIILLQTFFINTEEFILKNNNCIITFKLKYNILFNSYQSFYIFNHCLCNFHITLNSNFYKSKYSNFIGCGLQLDLPFQQITYIRLEYMLNI